MSGFEPWEARDVVMWLVANGGELRQAADATTVQFPNVKSEERKAKLALILPHLKARKAEVLAILYPPADRTPAEPYPKPNPFAPDPFNPVDSAFVQLEQIRDGGKPAEDVERPKIRRKRLLSAVRSRAAELNRPVYYLLRDGRAVLGNYPPVKRVKKELKTWKVDGVTHSRPYKKRIVLPVDVQATHVCVEGDTAWVKLPKTTTREQDEILNPPRKSPNKAKRWEGG